MAEASGIGRTLSVNCGDDAERAHRAGQELGEVVAGDVLDDPAAPLDHVPLGRDEADADDLVAGPAGAEPPRPGGVGRVDPAERRPVGMGGVDQQPLTLLGQDRPQGREGHPGLDGDRHVGGRVVDQAVERPGVDGHARPARDAAVVERGAAALRVDGVALGRPARGRARGAGRRRRAGSPPGRIGRRRSGPPVGRSGIARFGQVEGSAGERRAAAACSGRRG